MKFFLPGKRMHVIAFRRELLHIYSTTSKDSLYRRISPVGDPNVSVIPVLDQWVLEGKPVHGDELQKIVKELRIYKRFNHALQVTLFDSAAQVGSRHSTVKYDRDTLQLCQYLVLLAAWISKWMSDKRYLPPSAVDISERMNLILRVHGLDQVEDYFNSIPSQLKKFQVHVALLNCYAHEKCVDKANVVLQKMKEMGFDRTPLPYNIMMNIYYKIGEYEKLDPLMQEMEEKGVSYDRFTYSIRLSAYAAASDIEGVDKIMEQMESDPKIVLDWNCCVIAANGYLKVGLVDKSLAMLRKSEGLLATAKRKVSAFDSLLKLYATNGKKDEVHRVWNLYKKEKVYNKGYISMMRSLLILDDIEAAEHIFKEWKTRKLSYDLRIPNMLLDAYCRKGLMEKAEAFVNETMTGRGKFSINSWCYLASGYIQKDRLPQAVDTLKKAATLCPSELKHLKEILVTFLEGKQDVKEAEKVVDLLRAEAKSYVSHDTLIECDDECA